MHVARDCQAKRKPNKMNQSADVLALNAVLPTNAPTPPYAHT